MGLIKGLHPSTTFLCVYHFFLLCFFVCFIFIAQFFRRLAEACMNPRSFSLFAHSLVCLIIHSFLYGFQPNSVQHFPQCTVCSTCHTVFSLKNINVFAKGFHNADWFLPQLGPPANDLHKLSVTQLELGDIKKLNFTIVLNITILQ